VPTAANLLPAYHSFTDLVEACVSWCERINGRAHRETAAAPATRLAAEHAYLHVLPAQPHAIALGEERLVDADQTIRFGSVRYSTPDGHQGGKVWCRAAGDELVITARDEHGLVEIARHELSTPGNPRICRDHYPHHPGQAFPREPRVRPRTKLEIGFLALGEGARRWLVEAGATGITRIRAKVTRAIELAAVIGATEVDQALGLAAIAGRFAEDDLASILDHLSTAGAPVGQVVVIDENHSAQPGNTGWERFGS
jgi:hypothetical protein